MSKLHDAISQENAQRGVAWSVSIPGPKPTDKPIIVSHVLTTRESMLEAARAYMVETYGPAKESSDRDKWHERYGLLIDFIGELTKDKPEGRE